jgi:hypothetical protein
MALTPTQRDLLDTFEIQSLLTRERYYRDTSQWTNLRAAYHPDASRTHIKVSWFEGNVDAFIEQSRKMASSGTAARHVFQPVEVRFSTDRNRAVSEAQGNIAVRFEIGGKEFELTSWTRFLSKVERVDGEWKMLTLEPIYVQDGIVSVLPGGGEVAKGEVWSSGPRESYKCLAWVLGLKGYKIDLELAGTDRPETVERLMRGYFEWLSE